MGRQIDAHSFGLGYDHGIDQARKEAAHTLALIENEVRTWSQTDVEAELDYTYLYNIAVILRD